MLPFSRISYFHFIKTLAMRLIQLIFITAICSLLTSCEGAVDLHGHVYDRQSSLPLDSVQIILVLDGRDTLWNCSPSTGTNGQPELMTGSYIPAYTDTNGYFLVSSGLIGMGPGDLDLKVMFTRNGYAPVIVIKGESTSFDSVRMQRL